MEIEIHQDPNDRGIFTTEICSWISIQTTLATDDENRHRHSRTLDDFLVNDWVRQVKKIYCKKKRQPLAVGLSAERSDNYANGTGSRYSWWRRHLRSKPEDSTPPYELLKICVGNHCLIYDPCYKFVIPRVLRDLLSDNNTIVFGVGIHGAAKKLEDEYGIKISRPWDLCRLAECYKGFHEIEGVNDLDDYNKITKPGYYEKYSLEQLAKVVLGPEWEVVKPASIKWYVSRRNHYLSDEKVKFGTIDAFLAYEMGMKFLDIYRL